MALRMSNIVWITDLVASSLLTTSPMIHLALYTQTKSLMGSKLFCEKTIINIEATNPILKSKTVIWICFSLEQRR